MRLRRIGLLPLCLVLMAGAVAAEDESDAQLKQERAAIAQRLTVEEAACYKKFAVNDCLRAARKQARSAQSDALDRENAIKASERRERSAMHQQELRGKRASAPEQASRPVTSKKSNDAQAKRPNQRAPRAALSPADKALTQRAAQQRRRSEQAEKARQRLLEKQRSAAERAQSRARSEKQRQVEGHREAKPLPDLH